jgi:hypothetical protein
MQSRGSAEYNSLVDPEFAVFYLNEPQNSLRWVVLDYDLKLPNCTGATLAEAVRSLGVKIALSSGYQIHELPQEVHQILWDAILSKEAQDPDKVPKLTQPIEAFQILSDLPLSELRHSIKNELAPLKAIYRFLKNKDSLDLKTKLHVELLRKGLDAVEGIVSQTLH